jgi:hypothetical protein
MRFATGRRFGIFFHTAQIGSEKNLLMALDVLVKRVIYKTGNRISINLRDFSSYRINAVLELDGPIGNEDNGGIPVLDQGTLKRTETYQLPFTRIIELVVEMNLFMENDVDVHRILDDKEMERIARFFYENGEATR